MVVHSIQDLGSFHLIALPSSKCISTLWSGKPVPAPATTSVLPPPAGPGRGKEGAGLCFLVALNGSATRKLPILTFDFLEPCQRTIHSCKRVWEIESLVGQSYVQATLCYHSEHKGQIWGWQLAVSATGDLPAAFSLHSLTVYPDQGRCSIFIGSLSSHLETCLSPLWEVSMNVSTIHSAAELRDLVDNTCALLPSFPTPGLATKSVAPTLELHIWPLLSLCTIIVLV